MRILVVEDDPVLSNGLKVGLGLSGATVDTVVTCADAYAALATSTFDAVVLDLMLPDGSGLDVLASIRKTGDKTPVLLLSALDEVADRIKGLVVHHSDFDVLIPSHSRIGKLSGGTRISMLLGTPG